MSQPKNDFENAASGKQSGIVAEFIGFLKQNKKFWLLPLIIVMLLMAVKRGKIVPPAWKRGGALAR